jgi:hypothetical protein
MGDEGGEYYSLGYCSLVERDCPGRPKGACGVCRTRVDYQARLEEIAIEIGLARKVS